MKTCTLLITVIMGLNHSALAQRELPVCITNIFMNLNGCLANVCEVDVYSPDDCAVVDRVDCTVYVNGASCLLSSSCQTNDALEVVINLLTPAGANGYDVGWALMSCSDGSSSSGHLVVPPDACHAVFTLCGSCPPCALTVVPFASGPACACGSSPVESSEGSITKQVTAFRRSSPSEPFQVQTYQVSWSFKKENGRNVWKLQKSPPQQVR